MSRRASLPGADELFRKTAGDRSSETAPSGAPDIPEVSKSTKLQVALRDDAAQQERRHPKHDEKITFYCTRDDLMAIERTRLRLRSEHGVAADRGRIVRAAVSYVLQDFEARGEDSILLRHLAD